MHGGDATVGSATSLLRTIFREQRLEVVVGSALWIGHQLGEMAVPVVVGIIIDRAVATGDEAALVSWVLLLVVIFAAFSNSYRYGLRIVEGAQLEAMHRLVMQVTRRVLHPTGGAEKTMRPGALVATAAADAEAASDVIPAVAGGAAAIAALLAASVALLSISVPLGLMVLIGLPIVVGLIQLLVLPLERRVAEQREQATAAAGIAADLVTGLRVLKGLGVERRAAARYQTMSRRSLAAGIKAANVEAVHGGAAVLTTGIVIAAVVLVGGRLAIDDTISIGALVAAVGLAQFLVGPLLRVGFFGALLGHARASSARIVEVLASEAAVEQGVGTLPAEVRGELDVQDLHGPALHGLDLHLGAGELVGLAIGEPAAAAELLDVLGRTAEPSSGTVLVDGVDVHELDLAATHAALVVSHHDGELFSGTIRENVASAGVPDHELGPTLAAADADEVAQTQEHGLDTLVTERGRSLSGGQKQRIVLARALAADPPVLVLHDPTTAVDAATKAQIAGSLRQVRQGRTTLVLTTSPALLAVADRVLLVEDGRVVAEGRHEELVTDARYREAVLR